MQKFKKKRLWPLNRKSVWSSEFPLEVESINISGCQPFFQPERKSTPSSCGTKAYSYGQVNLSAEWVARFGAHIRLNILPFVGVLFYVLFLSFYFHVGPSSKIFIKASGRDRYMHNGENFTQTYSQRTWTDLRIMILFHVKHCVRVSDLLELNKKRDERKQLKGERLLQKPNVDELPTTQCFVWQKKYPWVDIKLEWSKKHNYILRFEVYKCKLLIFRASTCLDP